MMRSSGILDAGREDITGGGSRGLRFVKQKTALPRRPGGLTKSLLPSPGTAASDRSARCRFGERKRCGRVFASHSLREIATEHYEIAPRFAFRSGNAESGTALEGGPQRRRKQGARR